MRLASFDQDFWELRSGKRSGTTGGGRRLSQPQPVVVRCQADRVTTIGKDGVIATCCGPNRTGYNRLWSRGLNAYAFG